MSTLVFTSNEQRSIATNNEQHWNEQWMNSDIGVFV